MRISNCISYVCSSDLTVDEEKLEVGVTFDGSSIAGWKGIEASDMVLIPDAGSARMDPFREEPTLNLTCEVVEPSDLEGSDRDPRSFHKRAEAYIKSSIFVDTAYFCPGPGSFVFDALSSTDRQNGRWGKDGF